MLYYETIKPETLDLLRRIQKLGVYENTRLVGGTALALQIGHRVSVDLDFFGVIQEDPMPFMLIPVEWKEIKKTITKVVEEEFKSRI